MLDILNENKSRQILQRIEERLTRIESKLHNLEGVRITPKQDNVACYPTLGDIHYRRIGQINRHFGKGGWFSAELAASMLEIKEKDVANLIFLIRKSNELDIKTKDIPNSKSKMYSIQEVA